MISGLKPLLNDERFGETSSWAEIFHLEDLVAIVMRQLKRLADDTFGVDAKAAVIGFPVHFQTSDTDAVAFSRLRAAAEQAGFEHVEFCPEPVAAVSGESKALAGKTVCSVDFGGGTFDVVVLRFDPSGDGSSDLLGIDGVPVGGELFDGKLFDHVVVPLLKLDAEFEGREGNPVHIPNQVRTMLRSLADIVWMAADPNFYFILRSLQAELLDPQQFAPVMDIIYGGQAFDFFSAIERAKRELSASETSRLSFRRGAIDIEVDLSRSQFERLIRPELEQVRGSIETALEMAETAPREVDLVLRTGGSALLPAFNEMLDQIFGAVRVESRPAFTSVAAGLAEIAARSARARAV